MPLPFVVGECLSIHYQPQHAHFTFSSFCHLLSSSSFPFLGRQGLQRQEALVW
jgi:hypothetical protein